MVRNSLKYVPDKNKKEVAKDLREIYNANTEQLAGENLKKFKDNLFTS